MYHDAFVRWIEFLGLDNCLAMITCNELCDCDGRAQVLLNELRELFGGCLLYTSPSPRD